MTKVGAELSVKPGAGAGSAAEKGAAPAVLLQPAPPRRVRGAVATLDARMFGGNFTPPWEGCMLQAHPKMEGRDEVERVTSQRGERRL